MVYNPALSGPNLRNTDVLVREPFSQVHPVLEAPLSVTLATMNPAHSEIEPPPFCSAQVTSTCNRGKQVMPLDTTHVRRSARANKYDGFKISQPKDVRVTKSRVKPRIIPSVSAPSANPPDEERVSDMMKDTPIPVLQHMGASCGVPAKDLSPQKLLASAQEEDSAV